MNTLKNLLFLNDDERLLAEVRTYQEKLISNAEEPIWERKCLTIEEAALFLVAATFSAVFSIFSAKIANPFSGSLT